MFGAERGKALRDDHNFFMLNGEQAHCWEYATNCCLGMKHS